jgi:tetratricopeptide (TPR) repeat protein
MKSSALLLLIPILAVAQSGTTPTTGSGGQTSVQANPNSRSAGPAASRPIYISGKVIKQDGPVLSQVTIERVCGGVPKTVAYTDSKGHFSFQWGELGAIVADASDAGSGRARSSNTSGFGSAQSAGGNSVLAADPFGSRMMNCELRANVAGYTSDVVNLFNKRSGENSDVGTIILHRIAGAEGSSISVTSLLAPKDAKKAYEHGLQALLKDKHDEAAKDFEKAVAIYPNYADAWVSLGKLRLEEQAMLAAKAAFRAAMDADSKLVAPHMELGLLAAKDLNWQESAKYLDRAVELDPVDFPQAWYADAVAHFNLADYDAAERSARMALKLDPNHANPRSSYLLGLALAEKHDYAGAVEALTTYIKVAPNAPDIRQAKAKLEELDKLAALP